MSHASSAPQSLSVSVERCAAATSRYVRYIVTGAAGAVTISLPSAMDGPETPEYVAAYYSLLAAAPEAHVTSPRPPNRRLRVLP